MKILVIQQKMIGDVLTSSILFEVLRQEYPDAELHYLIYRHTLPVVEHNPHIDRVILFEEEYNKAGKFFPFLQQIRKERYKIIFDVYSKIGTALLAATSGAEFAISYEKWYTRRFYTHVVQRHSNSQTGVGLAIENRLRLLSPVVKSVPAEIKPKIYLTSSEVDYAGKTLESAGISSEKLLLMISVLGSSPVKTYPHEYLAELLDQIVEETKAQLLFNYIPKQLEDSQRIFRHCKPATQEHIFLNIFGKNLREFMALTSYCDALIGNEGGAINMAKALDIPTFAIFSPAISKEDWSLFESKENVAVHLQDYRPELFSGKSKKGLQKKTSELYSQFKPELISEKLNNFLNILQKKKKKKNY